MTSRGFRRGTDRKVAPAVHQFHGSTSAGGDAITQGLFFTRDLLRELGFSSEIYSIDIPPELANDIRPALTFPDGPEIVLLVHYSWAIPLDGWLSTLRCRKVLVYHNITPGEFFQEGDWFDRMAAISREQLASFMQAMEASMAQSRFSADELLTLGYRDPQVLPLLFDPATWLAEKPDASLLSTLAADDSYKILFVGRLVRNKCQTDLLPVVDQLRHRLGRPVRLYLVGGTGADQAYVDQLDALTQGLGLQECVVRTGKVDIARLRALYRGCDVFLCLSDHEGFCVPAIESMALGLPVVAYASSALPETVGSGGLLLEHKDPAAVAALLKVLHDEPALRRHLVRQGQRTIARFSRSHSLRGLASFLAGRLGLEPAYAPPVAMAPDPAATANTWLIEGPFDSSYSLALLNRSLARALAGEACDVGLRSREGNGPFDPNPDYLAAHPAIAAFARRAEEMDWPDVAARNLYPPLVGGMSGTTRLLAGWGWEESDLPRAWVAQFNRELNLVTVVSRFVAKALRDNGVRVPVAIVGNGSDHAGPTAAAVPKVLPPRDGRFRFLHISSGFPRKGVDILLEAWAKAFDADDGALLVIKTFPNPHNDVAGQISALRDRAPRHAEIVFIDADLADAEIAALHSECDAYVAPSRGEGFGLPVAEAMRHNLPTIVTAHGGMLDFCDDTTSWLVDYRFAESGSHFDLFGSVWAEPLVESLVQALRDVRHASRGERRSRTDAARRRVQQVFTWQRVAQRSVEAVEMLDRLPVLPSLPSVALITTWNERCGIASYARDQASAFPHGQYQVFASRAEAPISTDEPFVRRCWTQGWEDDLHELHDVVRASGADAALIQFNFGFFALPALERLLDRLKDAGIACTLVLHSTQDVCRPGLSLSLGQIRDSLARAHRLIVHSVADLNRLKALAIVDNVTLMPHGVAAIRPADCSPLRERAGPANRTIVATFGYLLPD